MDDGDERTPVHGFRRPAVLLDRYAASFESADIDALTRLLTDDVMLEMPPAPAWYAGRRHYRHIMARVWALRGPWRVLPITGNGQPGQASSARAG